MRITLKNNYINTKNNKNKILDIKIIFKIIKNKKKYFRVSNRLIFYKIHKTVFKNYFLLLFSKIVTNAP